MIGKTLSHYEIKSQLAKGGMGEVYKAIGQKLRREVAIKVLLEEFHGRELFYHNGDAVMAVTWKQIRCSNWESLKSSSRGNMLLKYEAQWPGRRFLMMKAVETTGKMPAAESPRKINVVLNWTEELKQRVPVK